MNQDIENEQNEYDRMDDINNRINCIMEKYKSILNRHLNEINGKWHIA